MKNIKSLEIIAVCLFSFLLFSFAVVQEKNPQGITGNHIYGRQIKAAQKDTLTAFNLKSDSGPNVNFIPVVSFSKFVSVIVPVIAALSFIILLAAFIFYNSFSIRP
jgi:hypothetical protein